MSCIHEVLDKYLLNHTALNSARPEKTRQGLNKVGRKDEGSKRDVHLTQCGPAQLEPK